MACQSGDWLGVGAGADLGHPCGICPVCRSGFAVGEPYVAGIIVFKIIGQIKGGGIRADICLAFRGDGGRLLSRGELESAAIYFVKSIFQPCLEVISGIAGEVGKGLGVNSRA